ncbi:hypothetical protein ACOMHN_013037 [Nucella lapillus]
MNNIKVISFEFVLQGRSEYKTNFKWFESSLGKSFKPAPEQLAPAAGQDTVFSKISHEPALQHKKRLDGPPSTFSINLDDGNYKSCDDFALLGKQQKFASNVPYGLRTASANVSKAEAKEKDLSNNNNNNNNNNSVPPPPKQMKMAEKQQTPPHRKLDMAETRSTSKKEAAATVTIKENLTPSTPPPAPRKGDNQQAEKRGLKDKNLADILTKSKAAATKDKMNEGVQTDMDKGVTSSNQEATADYSLKYKAGMAPARAARKPSEYQKQFTWKKGIPASPLLSAEQMIHNSNTQISPSKRAVIPKRTEYQTQYKTYKMPEAAQLAPKPSQEPPVQRGRSTDKTQMKRSKSVGAGLSPDRSAVAAGSAPLTSAEDPRLLRESRNASPVPKVPLAHGKLKHRVSEYRSNYKAPTRFSYEGGAWRYAYPAYLLQNKNGSEAEKAEKGEEQPANWFAEVLELRRRASEYKRRAQGTHFSREHLVQLLAQQAGYWDVDSACSSRVSSLDALALEPAKPAAGMPSFSKPEVPVDKISTMAVQGDYQDNEDDASISARNNLRPAKKGGRRGKKSKMAWQEEAAGSEMEVAEVQDELNFNQNAACDVQSTEDVDEAAGRLPTPLLQQRREKLQRHHLDRTTPSIGGVLLSAPVSQQVSARSGDTEETVTESELSSKTKFTTEGLYMSPTLGKPTPDTHALRDETAESDHAMEVHYISSPQMSLAKSNRNLKALQRRMNAKIPTTIDERMGETYKATGGNFCVDDLPLVKDMEKDDDVLSLSARSIASSASLASEVYERARLRRDNFWSKGSH